ncbi:MAG TPA: hypothetical protein VGK59_10515 [Ohtaekwangia sp.]
MGNIIQDLINTVWANPLYLTLGVILVVVLIYALIKRILKLVILLVIAFILFLVYVHYTGNSAKDRIERMIRE